jgi:hypothetical protein
MRHGRRNAAVRGRIFLVARRDREWQPVRVRLRLIVPVDVGVDDRRDRPPEIEVIL